MHSLVVSCYVCYNDFFRTSAQHGIIHLLGVSRTSQQKSYENLTSRPQSHISYNTPRQLHNNIVTQYYLNVCKQQPRPRFEALAVCGRAFFVENNVCGGFFGEALKVLECQASGLLEAPGGPWRPWRPFEAPGTALTRLENPPFAWMKLSNLYKP